MRKEGENVRKKVKHPKTERADVELQSLRVVFPPDSGG
jgi:hypothetical protein